MANTSYMKLTGKTQGAIQGDCTQKGREKTIMVYGVEHAILIPTDTHSGLPTGNRIHKPLVITKAIDSSSPKLMQAVCSGEHLDVELDFFRISEKGQEEHYYTIKLVNAVVVSTRDYKPLTFVELNKPYKDMEEISFSYQKIMWTYVPAGVESEDDWDTPRV